VDNAAAIRVVLVEDNDVFRQALELMLATTRDISVVAAVADGRAAVVACESTQPDVVLMDYRLPGLDGVEATLAVREVCGAAVVALTATADRVELDALLDAGAVTCLTKDSRLDEIVGAIRDAARREGEPVLGRGGRATHR
jgi:DNA-binding NarL/FixJ family response regulator